MKKYLLIPLVILITAACAKEKGTEPVDGELSGIRIPVSQVPLYADLSNYDQVNHPKTRADEETVTLESLLNYAKTVEKDENGYHYTVIPFNQNETNIYTLTYSAEHDADLDVPSRVKKYFIRAVSETGDEKNEFVAVMITSYEYAEKNPDFGWYDMDYYTGNVMFATPEGELIQNLKYTNGRVIGTQALTPEEYRNNTEDDVTLVVLLKPSNTRVWELTIDEASLCVAYKDFKPIKGGGGGTGDSNDDKDIPGRDNTGHHGATQDGVWDNNGAGILLPNIPPVNINVFSIKVRSNRDDIDMYVNNDIGGGCYQQGVLVQVRYDDHSDNFVELPPKFSHWTGDFSVKTTPQFNYKVTNECVESTAYWEVKNPCPGNPLDNMSVAPTISGKASQGLFGAVRTRTDGTKYTHNGIDLYAEPGTPIYATQDGIITGIFDNAPDEQVNESWGALGNYITVTCDVEIPKYNDDAVFYNSKQLSVQYCHLQYGNPVAWNYLQGRPYQPGDRVYRGDIIGYSGRTGNAYDTDIVPWAHVHFQVGFETVNGTIPPGARIDPMPYLNVEVQNAATIDANGGRLKSKKDCE
jgi:Membrane proteins related to metalloendopeptidases